MTKTKLISWCFFDNKDKTNEENKTDDEDKANDEDKVDNENKNRQQK